MMLSAKTVSALLVGLAIVGSSILASAQPLVLHPEAREQIRRLIADKAARGPIARKIGSQLLYATRMQRGLDAAPGVPFLRVDLDRDA